MDSVNLFSRSSTLYKRNEHKRAETELPLIINGGSARNMPFHKLLLQYPGALYSDRIIMTESSTGKIGPGHYNCSYSTLGGPSFVFSSVNRFPTSFSGVTSPIPRENIDFMQKNKELDKYLPQNQQELLKVRAKNHDNKLKSTLNNKKIISKEKKKAKLRKIKEKHQKFQMKIQFHEVKQISNCWLTMMMIITSTNSLSNLIKYQKDLHYRSGKVLKQILLFSKMFGKFRMVVRRVRIKKAKGSLNTLARKIRFWVRIKNRKYKTILLDTLEAAALKDKMFRLMYQWKYSLSFLQKNLRKMLIEKKLGLALKMLQWEKVEKNMHEANKKVTRIGIKKRFQSLIPASIRENIIKQALKKRVKEYHYLCKMYKLKIEEAVKKIQDKEMNALIQNRRPSAVDMPEKPKPCYDFSKKDYMEMIKEAVSTRRASRILTKPPSFIFKK
jgi:hypothetical protein